MKKMINIFTLIAASLLCLASCTPHEQPDDNNGGTGGNSGNGGGQTEPEVPQHVLEAWPEIALVSDYCKPDEKGDRIPDFSRVGYHCGESDFSHYPVRATVTPSADESADDTKRIQDLINSIETPGAILLKKGTYRLSKTLNIYRSGIELIGEGEETVLYNTTTAQTSLMRIALTTPSRTYTATSEITGYTPCGSDFVVVEDASLFNAGDEVEVYRPATAEWIHAIGMDQIDPNGGNTVQWTPSAYGLYYDRTVVLKDGNKLYLDNPIVMAMESQYGGGQVRKYNSSNPRVKEVAICNMTLRSYYNGSTNDENHSRLGIEINYVQDCWIENVTSERFWFGLAELNGARYVTIKNCHVKLPTGTNTGSRRYGFYFIGKSTANLVINCTGKDNRHTFSSGSTVPGPNAFVNCTDEGCLQNLGPHMRWATGILYDCVSTDKELAVENRGPSGSGHGWAGANHVFWNCEARPVVCQKPVASATNWAFGCTGTKAAGDDCGFAETGVGLEETFGTNVTPHSLYEAQVQAKKAAGLYVYNLKY